MNQFIAGEKVRCIIGGPDMIVVTVNNVWPAIQPAQAWPIAIGGHFQVNVQPQAPQQPTYNCMWWNAVSQVFSHWTFNEFMLEAIEK